MLVFRYQTGEEIKKDDRVLFHGQPGRIELVAVEIVGEPENDWHMNEHGGGIMILEDVLGRSFIPAEQIADLEDLEFVARADAQTRGRLPHHRAELRYADFRLTAGWPLAACGLGRRAARNFSSGSVLITSFFSIQPRRAVATPYFMKFR